MAKSNQPRQNSYINCKSAEPQYAKLLNPVKKLKVFDRPFFKRVVMGHSVCKHTPGGKHIVACGRLRTLPQWAKTPYGRRSANGCSGRKRPRGKNYFAFSFLGEIILQAFPTGTLRPCKRGRSLMRSHIKLFAFHSGTPC